MTKFHYNIFIFLCFFIRCDKPNNAILHKEQKNDSLDYYFKAANNDSLTYESKLKYTQKALSIISKNPNDSLNRVHYFKIANRFFNMNNIEAYKKTTWQIIEKSKQANDTLSLGKAYSYMIDYHIYSKNTDSTYWYNNEAEKLYIKINDHLNVAKILLNKAILQHNASDYLGCEKTVFSILKHLRFINNNALLYESYNLLGIVYAELSEYNLSKKYYNLAIQISSSPELAPEFQLKAFTLNNLGVLYHYQERDQEAIKIFQEALIQKNLKRDKPITFAMLKDNLGYSKYKSGDLLNLPDLFYESLTIKDSLKIIPGIILSKIHLSEYYISQKDTLKALKFAKEANELAVTNKEKRDQLNTLKQLANVDPKKALKYSTEYFKINDSLQIAERKARNKFARIEYETEELTLEKNKLVEQRKTIIYIGLGILLIGGLIFVIRFQAAKNRELMFIQEQQKANEEIYQLMINQQNKAEEVRQAEKKRIAQELHDGVLGKLFGTRMNLGVLNNRDDADAKTERVVFIDELKNLEQELREISHDLNSEKTAVANNFVAMVTHFLETQKTVCKAAITFTIDPNIEWNRIENMAKINFYRILQEAFQNINKYANAETVKITFQKDEQSIKLNIEDDGMGFVYSRKKKGIGLQNMNTRISSSGGFMEIKSEPGKGTLLKFELPIA